MSMFKFKSSGVSFKILICLCVTHVWTKSRVKRYLTYPPNSAVVLTMSLLKIMPPGHGVNSMTEFDIFHPLPEYTKQALPGKGKHKRERRDLLQQLETILEDREFNGRACIQRAICEAEAMSVDVNADDLVREFFHLIFQPISKASYSCDNSMDQDCPFSPLRTILAWTQHFRQQTADYNNLPE